MVILKNFIVFEGIDGAGTTTQQKLLQKKLQAEFP
ncbi:MAG: dTMP kinase, partial [Spirochaetaceae bacterium]|nr:dTMP kinase [Spirochaetaceae bacterium]